MRDENKYYTVSAINNYIAYKLSTDIALKVVYVKGELSNVRVSKGHIYFVLKDSESELSGIIFANIAYKLTFMPKDGMKVLITGSITPYSKKGTYNLIVNEIIDYGKGYLYQKFLESKERLESIGLFDSNHKKRIPMYSENIGVITSSTGDALNDIISTIERRFPLAKVYLYPALVQGSDAPKSLCKALLKASRDKKVDVVIIARGGGSFEDLNCFNDEILAKTIYDFDIPIVSGVGHENDYTICDFVCDDRAPTPTGAAVKVTPDKEVLYQTLANVNNKLNIILKKTIDHKTKDLEILNNNYYLRNFDNIIKEYNEKLEKTCLKLKHNSPLVKIDNYISNVASLEKRLNLIDLPKKISLEKDKIDLITNNIYKCYEKRINTYIKDFSFLLDKLTLVNPLDIMKKGYTVVYKDDKVISSSNDIKENDELTISFYDGRREVKVLK